MLVYFRVGNYKSIKEPIVINFNAAAIGEHKDSNVRKKGKHDLLKTVLLYGSNASGKSKILDALIFFKSFILTSATDKQSTEDINTEPFLLNTSTAKEPSLFEAEFILGNHKYRYGFHADSKSVTKEWLLEVKSTTESVVFLRIGQQFEINEKKFINASGLEKRTRKNALFLSVAAQWNVLLAEDIVGWFNDIYTVHGMKDRVYRDLTTNMLKNSLHEKAINNLVRKADLGINSIGVAEFSDEAKKEIIDFLPDEMKNNYIERFSDSINPVFAMHNVYNDAGEKVDETAFLMNTRESEGTQKFYNLVGLFVDAVLKGKLVIIDELDARLHTLLSRAIIQLFNSSEIDSDAQLLAVSHDTALMDTAFFRRDQICFVEKDSISATKVISLVEYKVRKESPFYKNYLEGKYGAIPFIENLETILDDGKEN